MEQVAQIRLIDRVLEHVAASSLDVEAAPSSFPARLYSDPERNASESTVLFSGFPIVVGASVQLAEAGSFIAREVNGVPVLVTRQVDGGLKAHLNICRHRGARVVPEGTGTCSRRHVCPYHGWTYGPDGSLLSIPGPDNFDGMDPSVNALVPLAVEEVAGLIFVVPDHRAQPGIAAYLGEFGRDLASFGLGDFEWYDSRTASMNHDWKMTIEGNQETYHFPVLHRTTAGRRFDGPLSLFDRLGPHTRSLMMHKRFRASVLPESREDWRVLEYGDLVYSLFPNTLVLLSHFSAHVLSVFPDGPGRAVVHGFTLVPPGTLKDYRREFFDVYWATMFEDIEVSEAIQVSAEAAPDLVWWRGRNEHLLRHFNASIDAALAGTLTADTVGADLSDEARRVS